MKRFTRKSNKGVTLVEIMMVVSIMGVLFLGLFLLINKVTKGTWQIGGTLGLNDAAAEAMYWIGNDFRNAKASTMGGQLINPALGIQAQNPGFELPLNLLDTPVLWGTIPANVAKQGTSSENVRSGFISMGLANGATYYSLVSTTTYSARPYVLSAWIKNISKGTAETRLLTSAGANFVPAVAASSTTASDAESTFAHATATSGNIAINTPFMFRLIHPTNNWFKAMRNPVDTAGRDYGYNYNSGPYGLNGVLGAYNGYLYMADMRDAVSSLKPVRWNGMQKDVWNDVPFTACGLPLANEFRYYFGIAPSMNSQYNGKVYSYRTPSVAPPAVDSADMYSFDGSNWALVAGVGTFYPGSATEGRSELFCYATFLNRMYVGGWWRNRTVGGPEPAVWENASGVWTRPYDDPAASDRVIDLCVNNNRLYALTEWLSGSRLVYTDDGITWITDAAFTARLNADLGAQYWARKMVSYNNNLYVAVRPLVGNTRLYYWDGAVWQTNAGLFLNEACQVTAMYVNTLNNVLYIGNEVMNVVGCQGGKIYSLNTAPPLVLEYQLPGANTSKAIRSFVLFSNVLYANYFSINMGAPNVGETGILQLGGMSIFDDVSLSPLSVVFSTSTTDRDYEYYTSKGRDINDFTRFKRYRLHYTPIANVRDPAYPATLRRQRFDGATWIDDGPDNVCTNVKKFTITNIKQESFDVELILEKITDAAGGKKEYKTNSQFTPAVP